MTSALILLALAGAAASFFFAGVETGAYSLNGVRLRLRLEEGSTAARIIAALLERKERLVATLLIGNNIANSVVASGATLLCQMRWPAHVELISTAAVVPFLFLFCEVVPKDIFRRHADRLVALSAPLLYLLDRLLLPLTVALVALPRLIARVGMGKREERERLLSVERLRHLLEQGAEEGTLTALQDAMARNIMDLRGITLGKLMVPIRHAIMVSSTASVDEALAEARRSGFTRLPVYRNRRAEVQGIVNVFELRFEERPGLTIRNYIRDVPRFDPETSAPRALVALREAGQPMGIVESDRKATGIVTVKDIVEELVGELRDVS